MYLIYDCSSIAQPLDYKAPFSDTFQWPRMIHISWIVLDKEFKPVEDFDCIVKPEGFAVTDKILKRAKIDQNDIDTKAIEIEDILKQFNESVEKVEYMFSHNNKFNENSLRAIAQLLEIEITKRGKHQVQQQIVSEIAARARH